MTCSKIFSGDLPELTYKIINYLQNDYSTLHSCILVNRLWCRLAIPLLWENPFSIGTGNYNFIKIYLNNLDDDLKTKLNEYKIINNSLPSNLLFNYLKFLKFLNINTFILYVEKWFEVAIKKNTVARPNNLTDICVPLFKIFIENEINLYTLEINVSGYRNFDLTCFDKILEFDSQIAFQISSLTENIKHNLNYLSINDDPSSVKIRKNSTLLQDLGRALPSKLEYLSLNLFIKVNDFMIFLEDSQDIVINKLIIIQRGWDDILHYIKEYIMKEKRIKYLAFMKLKNSIELYDLKNEVKEFKLHNIIVQNYVKLYINAHDFIVNTD
ncbi:unnamed protein product [Rhizophagus irregularis]|nr:unnamed protein product [Rhizophagus irregularis]